MPTRGIADLGTWNAPTGYSRRRHRGRGRGRRMSASAPAYMRYTILALAAALVVTLGWRGVRWTMHPDRLGDYGQPRGESPTISPPAPADLWQHDFDGTLDIAEHEAGAGNISSAEMAVDRAESMIAAEQAHPTLLPQDFF